MYEKCFFLYLQEKIARIIEFSEKLRPLYVSLKKWIPPKEWEVWANKQGGEGQKFK